MFARVAIVTGGRDYANRKAVKRALDSIAPTLLVHGGAKGADALACHWAQETCTPYLCVPADWEKDGKAAGMKRNKKMIRGVQAKADAIMLVAFPGGRGTEHATKTAQGLGIQVWEPEATDEFWSFSTSRMTVGVTVREGRVLDTPPVVAKFRGQPVSNLRRWMQKQPGYLEKRLK